MSRSKRGKLRAVVLYIARHFPDGINIEKVGLMVYLADLEAYRQLGDTITGSTYVAKGYGPEARGFHRVVADLARAGHIAVIP